MRLSPRWLRRRWQFVLLFWVVQGVAAYFLSLALAWIFLSDLMDRPLGWLAPFALMAVIMLLQAIFLLPIRRPSVSTRGWPILASLAIGGLLAGLLAVALALAVGHVLMLYASFEPSRPELILLGVLLGVWMVSTPLLIAFGRRGRREQILQRVSAGLFLGTIVEAAAIIPLDALVRRREDCVCATGTFAALAICGSVGLLAFGPAIFLPLVTRHRKRWYGRRCGACGYDMTGLSAADRCPECGCGWRPAAP